MRRIVILGSTGSIGRSALDVAGRHRDRFRVVGLAAGSNIDLLEGQIRAFEPEVVAVADETAALELRRRVGSAPEVLAGPEGVSAVAAHGGADFALSAMVGISGLIPTIRAIRSGKTVGLANKEVLVTAGDIVMQEARDHGVRILPVDSEHSAVFQCVDGRDRRFVKRVILTASGGPFFGKTAGELRNVTLEDALNHPSWRMGRKITIDSATLMNKGFEVIEAAHLFGLPAERIDVLIHPQSLVHSLVEFNDGSMLAQASIPDMRGPIAYALSYPERLDGVVAPLELDVIGQLTFQRPDAENFPCLRYAYEALEVGGTMPAVLNAANEVAVQAFLERRITFTAIPVIINRTMHAHQPGRADGLDAVIGADASARRQAREFIRQA